ncbi:hypothetical protein L5515_009536 [Caenorhabditis briggsae]|uniref:Uncharacterized protein n=1 Tax=Caenorhabditis briggsae TaxID=6238 RepID=A0AAE9FBV5_CAEBR|nr:hypothetical protein L5515_009536 [Caenorhabditis briggsae]
MMKFLILLLLLVSTAYSNRQSCADEINALRSRYANELSIANMNKLIYNPKLETKSLEKLESSGGCPDKSVEYGDGYIFGFNVNNSNALVFHVASNAGSMEVACVHTKCEHTGESITTTVLDFGKYQILAGPPGSRCSENRTADSNGLCSPENSGKSGKYVRKGWVADFSRGLYQLFRALRFG